MNKGTNAAKLKQEKLHNQILESPEHKRLLCLRKIKSYLNKSMKLNMKNRRQEEEERKT